MSIQTIIYLLRFFRLFDICYEGENVILVFSCDGSLRHMTINRRTGEIRLETPGELQ